MKKASNKRKPSKITSPIGDFKPGFHYGNKNNMVSKDLDELRRSSFNLKEELITKAKPTNSSIFCIIKNLFCCHQEKNLRNSPKTNRKPPIKKPLNSNEIPSKTSVASINLNQKSFDATLLEGITQTSTENSNQINHEISSKIHIDTNFKENCSKTTKAMLLENDLYGCPIETLFILRKDVGICNLLAKIKFVDFFLVEKNMNISKKSLSNPCSNHPNRHFFNLATYEKDMDFSSFEKESMGRKPSMNFTKNKENAEGNWTENLKLKRNTLLDQQILFNFYEKNMILDFDQWRNVTPEQCAKHTAKRIRNHGIILDAFCGIGGNLIYFAKENQVIGIDINLKTLGFAKHNAFNHGVFENVQLIQGDFSQMNIDKFNPDLVFLNPEIIENCNKEKFSIFTDITPDITATLLKSFNLCKNIILCLPKFTKINEIATLFSTILKITERKNEDITIEIEYFFINGELEQIQVYIGEIKQITYREELDFLYNFLFKGSKEKAFPCKNIRSFLKFVLRKLKLPKLCFYLFKIEDINNCEHSIFQKFLNVLRMYQEISLEEQDRFFQLKKIEECGELQMKIEKNEGIIEELSFKNSIDEINFSPSYYSGDIFTVTDDQKRLAFETDSSLNNEFLMDSMNY